VNISSSATVHLEGETPVHLTTVGAAIRNKKIVFNIPVYVVQFLVSDPSTLDKNGLPKSGIKQKALALHMTFLRHLDNDRILGSYRECLEANGFDLKAEPLQRFLELVKQSGDVKKGDVMTLYFQENAGAARLFFETGKLQSMQADKVLLEQILSLWFGKAADSGLKAMQKQLLQKI
jgi:hypothetical protein